MKRILPARRVGQRPLAIGGHISNPGQALLAKLKEGSEMVLSPSLLIAVTDVATNRFEISVTLNPYQQPDGRIQIGPTDV